MLFRPVILISAALCAAVAFAIPSDNFEMYPRGDGARSVRVLRRSSPIEGRDGRYLNTRSPPVYISRRSSGGQVNLTALTAREKEVICDYIAEGMTVHEIAEKMSLSVATVEAVKCSGTKKATGKK